jgi:hypothetical protein
MTRFLKLQPPKIVKLRSTRHEWQRFKNRTLHYKGILNNVLHKQGEYLGTCLPIHGTQINVSHINQTFKKSNNNLLQIINKLVHWDLFKINYFLNFCYSCKLPMLIKHVRLTCNTLIPFPVNSKSRIHEQNLESSPTFHFRFLYGFLKPYERGYGFLSGFPSFAFTETVRGCVILQKRWLWLTRKTIKTFVRISSKNSSSVRIPNILARNDVIIIIKTW